MQYDLGALDPDNTSGTELSTALTSWRDALLSGHGGASRPSYAAAGMTWVKTVSSTSHQVYYFDGADDILLYTVNPTANTVALAVDTITVAGNTTISAGTANGIPYLNGSKVLTSGSALQFDGSYLLAATTSNASGHALCHPSGAGAADGAALATIARTPGSGGTSFFVGTGTGGNAAASTIRLNAQSSNSRSISAGGTINASGADYAEYMRKTAAYLLHSFAKGDLVGINGNGELTPKFSEAISFGVKSTDPSLVGGDVWGSEDVVGKRPQEPALVAPEFPALPEVADLENLTEAESAAQEAWAEECERLQAEADQAHRLAMIDYQADLAAFEQRLEAARQRVDRIAFCGQVPVNVLGAAVGDFIIPAEAADGGLKGVAKGEDDMSLKDYFKAIGKVIAIEADGRARVIVKVV